MSKLHVWTVLLLIALVGAGCAPAVTLTQETFAAPLADTASPLGTTTGATIEVRSLFETIIVGGLATSSDQIIDARVTYAFPIEFSVSGEGERTVQLRSTDAPGNFSYVGETPLWTVGLHPAPALTLTTRSGAGDQRLNLGQFALRSVDAAATAGSVQAVLPLNPAGIYPVSVTTTTGNATVTLMQGAAVAVTMETVSGALALTLAGETQADGELTSAEGAVSVTLTTGASGMLRLVSRSGAIRVDAADDAPGLRVEVTRSGTVTLPPFMGRVSGNGQTGSWESMDYATADRRMTITIDAPGSSVIVR